MRAYLTSLAVAAISVVLGSCAEGLIGTDATAETALTPTPAIASANPAPVIPAQASAVELTKEELAMDCKKLRGRMHILILEVKAQPAKSGSQVARTLQQGVTPVFGGATAGTEAADSRRARQRAVLEAYNKRLAQKGCSTIDLAAELNPS